MCFSANASFAASLIIGALGTVAVKNTKTIPQLLFASIPIIFSLQQLSEGLLWLSYSKSDLEPWRFFFTYTYLIFAMALWPLWLPLSIRLLEKDKQRKKMLTILAVVGALVSALVFCIMLLYPIKVIPADHHLHYQFGLPASVKILIGTFTVLYIVATITPSFISSFKRMKWLGIVFMATYLLTLAIFPGAVISVWCYFAALLSLLIIWILAEIATKDRVLLPNPIVQPK